MFPTFSNAPSVPIDRMSFIEIKKQLEDLKEKTQYKTHPDYFIDEEIYEITQTIKRRSQFLWERFGENKHQDSLDDIQEITRHLVKYAEPEWLKKLREELILTLVDGMTLDAFVVILEVLVDLQIKPEEKNNLPSYIKLRAYKGHVRDIYEYVFKPMFSLFLVLFLGV